MAEYIEREAVLDYIDHMPSELTSDGRRMIRRIRLTEYISDSIPAADVVPVVHGRWIEDGYYDEPCVCSNCGEPCKDTVLGKPRWNYCPNCGALMDKEVDGE